MDWSRWGGVLSEVSSATLALLNAPGMGWVYLSNSIAGAEGREGAGGSGCWCF